MSDIVNAILTQHMNIDWANKECWINVYPNYLHLGGDIYCYMRYDHFYQAEYTATPLRLYRIHVRMK